MQCFHQDELGCHNNVSTLTISLVTCQKTYIFLTENFFCKSDKPKIKDTRKGDNIINPSLKV